VAPRGAVAAGREAARRTLGGSEVFAAQVKRTIERPARIADLDHASGLDHRVIGVRAMFAGR
jgi:hypothetical protein